MSSLNCMHRKFSRLSITLFVGALIISGCSGSGGSQSAAEADLASTDEQSPSTLDDMQNGPADQESASQSGDSQSPADSSSSATSDNGVSSESPDAAATEPSFEIVNDANAEGAQPEPVNNTPSATPSATLNVADPLIQNTILVSFDITVPAYQSNELRIELVWGDMNLTAGWIGDEYWSASADLPTDTEYTLVVTFYDNNGALELAGFEQAYRTGTNASETYTVTVDQFDANQFDADGDGASNLAELIEGTDPLIDESTQIEIRDAVILPNYVLSLGQRLEAGLSDERPYLESRSVFTPISEDEDSPGTSQSTEIDIDADGNGTVSYSSYAPWQRESHSGTRTRSGNSIMWEGIRTTYDGDYGLLRNFTNEVTILDENTRNFIQEVDDVYSGTYRDTTEYSSNVTGELMEGTSLCKPVSGTIVSTLGTNRRGFPFRTETTTVSKDVGDQYWKVVYVNRDGETTEYLARELTLRESDSNGRNIPTFICDFVDF